MKSKKLLALLLVLTLLLSSTGILAYAQESVATPSDTSQMGENGVDDNSEDLTDDKDAPPASDEEPADESEQPDGPEEQTDTSDAVVPGCEAELPENPATSEPDAYVSVYAYVGYGTKLYRDAGREELLGTLASESVMFVREVIAYEKGGLYETYFDTGVTAGSPSCEHAYFYASDLKRLDQATETAYINAAPNDRKVDGVKVFTADVRYAENDAQDEPADDTSVPDETVSDDTSASEPEQETVADQPSITTPTDTADDTKPGDTSADTPVKEPESEDDSEKETPPAVYSVTYFDDEGQILITYDVPAGAPLDEEVFMRFQGSDFLGWYACTEAGEIISSEPFTFGKAMEAPVYVRAIMAAIIEEEILPARAVSIAVERDTEALLLGSRITLTATLQGYDNTNFTYQWQFASADRDGNIIGEWQDVEIDALSFSYVLSEENLLTAWRLRVTLQEQ